MNNARDFLYGIALLSIISVCAFLISNTLLPFLSPLIIGILLGALLSPLYPKIPFTHKAIKFGSKQLLRAGIVLYGSYITFGEIATLGISGFCIAASIVIITFCSALIIGRILKLDTQISMLVGIGSAVCGAAAILALESTIKASPSKSSIALSFIVIFGLCGMVLLPLVYYSGLLPLSDYQWGILIGASLHEVGNVIGAGAISPEIQNIAILIKMTRVILLVPLLLIIAYVVFHNQQKDSKGNIYIPYFALLFLVVIVLNSIYDFPPVILQSAQFGSKILLVFAMVALGLQIDWQKFVSFGTKTFILAFILFVILLVSAYALVYLIC